MKELKIQNVRNNLMNKSESETLTKLKDYNFLSQSIQLLPTIQKQKRNLMTYLNNSNETVERFTGIDSQNFKHIKKNS